MPSFPAVNVTVEDSHGETMDTEVVVEFEVFCGSCGHGICDHADTRRSRRRGAPQVTVKPCEACMGAKDERISELESEITDLQAHIESLKEELAGAKQGQS